MYTFLKGLVCVLLLASTEVHAQSNLNVQFRSQLSYGSAVDLSNIWGYVDTLGNEYALVGAQTGLSIVDVSDPANPIQKFFVPGINSFWREVQTWGKYAYVTTEGCCSGLQIVDLSNLPFSVNSKYWTGTGAVAGMVGRIHSIHIRDAHAYLNGSQLFGGASLIVSLADPWNPVYLGNTQMSLSGNSRYVHDCFVKNDTLWGAHIYGGFFSAINISNKANPVLIATQNTPNNFTHNAWMSDQGTRVLFTTDEVSNSYLAAYNVSNTGNISLLDRLQGMPGSGSIIHNTYIKNSYAINSYYKDGITIVDVSRPENMITVGRYDTYTQGSGNGFNGAWGVYPYLPSGNILVSDIDNGLFVLTPVYNRACYLEGMIRDSCSNALLSNVSVQISGGTHHPELSKLNGQYKTGTALAGSYTVNFSKSGYSTRTISNVVLQNGVLNNLDVTLRPLNAVEIASALVTDVACHGASSGSVDIAVLNGTSPFSYSWSNGASTEDVAGLPAGNYTVTVTDGAACASVRTYVVSEAAPLLLNSTISNQTCSLSNDASIAVIVQGATPPYSFQWISPAPPSNRSGSGNLNVNGNGDAGMWPSGPLMTADTALIDSIGPGFYELYVTDNNGCVSSAGYTIVNPPNPCSITISMRMFIEGFYQGSNAMKAVTDPNNHVTDTLTLELRQAVSPYSLIQSSVSTVDTAGWAHFVFPAAMWQQSYFLVIRHRNSLETWSKTPFYLPAGVQQFFFTNSMNPLQSVPQNSKE